MHFRCTEKLIKMYLGSFCATKCFNIRLFFYDTIKNSPVGGVLPGGGGAIKKELKIKNRS